MMINIHSYSFLFTIGLHLLPCLFASLCLPIYHAVVALRYVTLNVEDFVSDSGQTDGRTANLLCWSSRVLLEEVVDGGGCCYQRINRYRYFSSPPTRDTVKVVGNVRCLTGYK